MRDTLHNKINATRNADGGKTKVIELAGKPIWDGLKRSVNFGGNNGCQMGANNQCIISFDHDCRINKSVYKIDCTPCKTDPTTENATYIGTTARTTHSRMIEHKRAILGRNASNALHKHQSSDHPNLQPQFEASVVRGGFQWNLERQIFEALEIESQKGNPNTQVLDSKSEWGNRGFPRLSMATD